MEIFKEFTFEAAHRLPERARGPQVRPAARPLLPGRGPRRAAPVGETTGWVMDFADLKRRVRAAARPARPPLPQRGRRAREPDQRGARPLDLGSARPGLPGLSQVVVRETCTSGCAYRGRTESRPAGIVRGFRRIRALFQVHPGYYVDVMAGTESEKAVIGGHGACRSADRSLDPGPPLVPGRDPRHPQPARRPDDTLGPRPRRHRAEPDPATRSSTTRSRRCSSSSASAS